MKELQCNGVCGPSDAAPNNSNNGPPPLPPGFPADVVEAVQIGRKLGVPDGLTTQIYNERCSTGGCDHKGKPIHNFAGYLTNAAKGEVAKSPQDRKPVATFDPPTLQAVEEFDRTLFGGSSGLAAAWFTQCGHEDWSGRNWRDWFARFRDDERSKQRRRREV